MNDKKYIDSTQKRVLLGITFALISLFVIIQVCNWNKPTAVARQLIQAEKLNVASIWATYGEGAGAFRNPYGIAVSPDEKFIYISDCLNNSIKKYDQSGELLLEWGTTGKDPGQLNYPADIAVDSKGRLYVTEEVNHRVQVFSPDGEFIASMGEFGKQPGQFDSPLGIDIDQHDNIYVVDYRNYRIQKFDKSRQFIKSFGTARQQDTFKGLPFGQFVGPYYIKIVADRMFVTEPSLNRVHIFSLNGELIGGFGNKREDWGDSSRPGEFHALHGIDVYRDGQLALADLYNDRIQVFSHEGEHLETFEYPGLRPKVIKTLADGSFLVGSPLSSNGPVVAYSSKADPTQLISTGNNARNTSSLPPLFTDIPDWEESDEPDQQTLNYLKYDLVSHKWQLGLTKSKGLYLPTGSVISARDGEFEFPESSIFIDNIFHKKNDQIIEARVLILKNAKWLLGTYTWDESSSGKLNQGGGVLRIDEFEHVVPSSQQCLTCHKADKPVIGFNPQLIDDDTVKRFSNAGLFSPAAIQLIKQSRTAGRTNLETRAFNYLRANCVFCHDGGRAVDFSATQLLDRLNTSSSEPHISPGDAKSSLIYTHFSSGVMPPATQQVDHDGVILIGSWINSLDPVTTGKPGFSIEKLTLRKQLIGSDAVFAFQGLSIAPSRDDQADERVLVASGYATSLNILNPALELQKSIPVQNRGSKGVELFADVAYSPVHQLMFWTAWRNSNIVVTNRELEIVDEIELGLKSPIGIDVSADGEIYISDYKNDRIVVYDYDRKKIRLTIKEKSSSKKLRRPYDVKLSKDRIYVSENTGNSDNIDNKIVVYDMKGRFLREFGMPDGEHNGIGNIQSIDIDNRQRIYAVDSVNNRICIFNPEGVLQKILVTDTMQTIRGLALSENNSIYLTGHKVLPAGTGPTEKDAVIYQFDPVY